MLKLTGTGRKVLDGSPRQWRLQKHSPPQLLKPRRGRPPSPDSVFSRFWTAIKSRLHELSPPLVLRVPTEPPGQFEELWAVAKAGQGFFWLWVLAPHIACTPTGEHAVPWQGCLHQSAIPRVLNAHQCTGNP